jgi:hypothetical protein
MGLTVDFNIIAVVLAAILYFGLGAFWYSRLLFGVQWMEERGIDPDKMEKPNPNIYLITFLAILLSSFVLVHLIKLADPNSNALTGAVTGFWVGLGVILTTHGINALYSGKSMRLFLIDVGYHLVGFLVMGAVLGQFA